MPTVARAVLFDLDETLFDHAGAARTALADWLPEALTAELTNTWFDLERVHYDSWQAGHISFDEQRRRRIRDFWPHRGRQLAPDDDLDALFTEYLTRYQASWRAFDDARPALVELSRLGYVTAVLTNGAPAQQNAKVDRIGLRDHIVAVITSEELGVAKPDPESYLRACRQLQVEPHQTLHVGDRHDLDVLAARAAGLEAVHLDRSAACSSHSEQRLKSLEDLPAHLENLAADDVR